MKSYWVVLGSVGTLVLWLFGPALGGEYTFVFRDAAHYYYPLFQWIADEWSRGRLPLWNPYENIGAPLVGENTSSVFYPGKLIFALPLDYTFLYNAYIVSHVVLAALASYRLARHWGASVTAAALASLSYAFSGNVLFQYCNVVFLVGAAWLPWAVMLTDRMLHQRRIGSAVGLGVVLTLMITGGDPQMAYNAGLLAALYALLVWRSRAAEAPTEAKAPSKNYPPLFQAVLSARSPILLAIAAATGALLAAVQILPSVEASRLSGRTLYDSPRSLFELASFLASPPGADQDQSAWYAGLLDTEPRLHQRSIYEFSVSPWRAVEFLWPNVGGRQFPTDCRWLRALSAEGRVWTPSMYMGLLPLVLASSTWTIRRPAPPARRWLSWMALIGASGSVGSYGACWVIREMAGMPGGPNGLGVGDEVGGVYWAMTVLLPGYVSFRYPAKLLVVCGLGLSMLAARGWDVACQSNDSGLSRLFPRLAIASLLGLCVATACWPWISARMAAAPPDPLFGPLDSAGAWRDVAGAMVQTTVLSMVLWAIFRPALRSRRGLADTAAIVVTLIDLALAQASLVAYAPAADWQVEPRALGLLPAGAKGDRIYRHLDGPPASWRRWSSAGRPVEGLNWDRMTLLPKYSLPYRVSMADVAGPIVALEYQTLLDWARPHGDPEMHGGQLPDASVLDVLAVRYALVKPAMTRGDSNSLGAVATDAVICSRPTARPRAWIVHQVESLPTLPARSPTAVAKRTSEVLFPDHKPRDWRQVAVVETDVPLAPLARPEASAEERCELSYSDPLRVEIDVRLAGSALVVLSDLDYPGWELTVETDGKQQQVPILRTNRVMRGALLPAGEHHLVYRYRPRSLLSGAAISGLTAASLVALALFTRLRRHPRSA